LTVVLDTAIRQIIGEGWTLELADGWHLVKTDRLHYMLSSN